MNHFIRRKIVSKVKEQLKLQKSHPLCGKFEQEQDILISKFSIEFGFTLSDFYNCNGKYLNKLLNFNI